MGVKPRLLITLGDVAGIGPEVVVKAWPQLQAICEAVVVGDVEVLRAHLRFSDMPLAIVPVERVEDAKATHEQMPCLQATMQDLKSVQPGRVSAHAGRAAFDFLCAAVDLAMAGRADGIVTLPLHKEGLRAAGVYHPGHTEILAERTGVQEFGMMLYAPFSPLPSGGEGPGVRGLAGLGVVHVTLHMALRNVFRHITTNSIFEKVMLLDGVMAKLCGRKPRLAVSALNPHASDGGLFGNEEATIITPAVERGRSSGIDVVGPLPADTLFVHAAKGNFDGVVAMYHDQGHIALKLLTGLAAVNVTLGLPIVRTSVAHGTAYDIAGQGKADSRSLLEAARVASMLATKSK
jgi:4-hydroxythreonine-4-phosphate dehydrogenase